MGEHRWGTSWGHRAYSAWGEYILSSREYWKRPRFFSAHTLVVHLGELPRVGKPWDIPRYRLAKRYVWHFTCRDCNCARCWGCPDYHRDASEIKNGLHTWSTAFLLMASMQGRISPCTHRGIRQHDGPYVSTMDGYQCATYGSGQFRVCIYWTGPSGPTFMIC